MITISAFKWVPDFAQGLVRDFRVRWALEEAGLPYQTRLIDPQIQKSPDYRSMQPFGQVPIYEEDGLVLFESGAIVIHIAEKSDVLMPRDAAGRAHAISHVFAALNSVEQFIQQLVIIDLFYPNEEWAKLRRPGAEEQLRQRFDLLQDLAGRQGILDRPFHRRRFDDDLGIAHSPSHQSAGRLSEAEGVQGAWRGQTRACRKRWRTSWRCSRPMIQPARRLRRRS